MSVPSEWDPLASEEQLLAPLSWPIPRTVAVSDLFGGAPDEEIDKAYAVMALCPHLTFRIPTADEGRKEAYLTTPHRPGTWKYVTVSDDGERSETPGSNVRTHSALCEIMPKAPTDALNRASAWQDERYPHGDGFMRAWPLPNVVYA